MQFKQFIEGKKILLLGPAPHILEYGKIADHEEYDTVVKLNKMVENLNLDTNNDILYHCLDVNPSIGDELYSIDKWISKDVRHLRISPPPIKQYYKNNINRFLFLNKNRINYSIMKAESYNELIQMCGNSIPNTGTTAIYDIMHHNPKVLSIRGITFFKGGYADTYKKRAN